MSELLPVLDDCWNRIGVRGDRSCAELAKAIHCHNCLVFERAGQGFFDRVRTAEYESELTALVAEAPDSKECGARSVLVFLVGGEAFALDTRAFVEVVETRSVHRVPHRSNPVFTGIVNVHGQLELCVSLVGLLDCNDAPRDQEQHTERLLLVQTARGRRWVFRASAVLGVHLVAESAVSEAPSTLTRKSQHFVSGVFELDEHRVAFLNSEALFAAFERSVR